jgi:hypothetical protein
MAPITITASGGSGAPTKPPTEVTTATKGFQVETLLIFLAVVVEDQVVAVV